MASDELGQRSNLLDAKSAIVTGAGDIGAVIARELVLHGAAVEVWDRSELALARARELCSGSVATSAVDITSSTELESAASAAIGRLGRVDVLVNTAAILTFAPVVAMDPAMWRETIDVNLTGVFLACRALLGHMIESRRGSIVNVSSIAGLRGTPELSHYSAAKFGIIGFTQSLAREAGAHGVRANCVCPGAIVSAMNTETLSSSARRIGASTDEAQQLVIERTPLGRQGVPMDVANAVVYLASELSSFVTAETIAVTGGLS